MLNLKMLLYIYFVCNGVISGERTTDANVRSLCSQVQNHSQGSAPPDPAEVVRAFYQLLPVQSEYFSSFKITTNCPKQFLHISFGTKIYYIASGIDESQSAENKHCIYLIICFNCRIYQIHL